MSDLLKLLDGSEEEVKAGLAGKSHDDLLKLKEAEQGGKTRKGVLGLLDAAISEAEAARTGGFVAGTGTAAIAADLDKSGPAGIAPATDFDPSGAPVQVVPDVDPSHPAVDNDPRADTTANMNRIDFNDPRKPGHEVVADALAGKN
ncbi:hypothetical protein [Sphingomonas leidyi]|uniref:hypothetical protein n=1 Tax=Sphingomonas leidyi TaxID=68569 RepID=UPI0036D24553